MARRRLYGALWKSFEVVLELINDMALRFNTEAADGGRDQVNRSSAASSGLMAELAADHAIGVTWDTEVDGDLDKINDYLYYLGEKDGVLSGDFSFSAGGVATITGAGRVRYRLGGVVYVADVDTTIILEGTGDVTQSKWGAWRILIDSKGVCSTQATDATGTIAHDSAEDAMLTLSKRSRTADTVEIGYCHITDSDSVFNIGTDNLTSSGVTVVYFEVQGARQDVGVVALGGTIRLQDGTTTWDSQGAIDARVAAADDAPSGGGILSGDLAQISEITNQAMDDADVVTNTGFGGWLLVTDLAQTGLYAIAANGIAGAVSTMNEASEAAVDTLLDAVEAALPLVFAPIARFYVDKSAGSTDFTANSVNWNADSTVATVTQYTNAALDRTSLAENVGIEAPAISATISAPLIASLTATAIGSDGRLGIAMAVHGSNAENVKFDNAIYYSILGQTYFKDVDAEIDISAECAGAGDTVSADDDGAMWMFVAADGTVDGETDKATQDYASAVLALAQYSIASNTLPVADHVPVGVIQVLESAGGGFTWGTDSITAETQTFYSFEGLPGIESAIASFALDAGLATVTYGAATIVLGTGVRVTLTGKAALAFTGTTEVAVGKTGAYLLYALADDTEVLVTATSTSANLQAAKDVVRDLAPNPLMPLLGVVYVTARSNAFTPGTTLLDQNGIDTTFVTYGVTTNRQEHGRSSGSTFTPVDEVLIRSAKPGQNERP